MSRIIVALLWFAASGLAAQAQMKIAVVDVDAVLGKYHQATKAKAKIDKLRQGVQERIQAEQDRGLKMLNEIEEMQKKARAMGESGADETTKQSMRAEYDRKVKSVRAHSVQLEQQKLELSERLQSEMNKLNENILKEVTSSIAAYGKKKGYDIVLNMSPEKPSNSDVLFVKNADDITNDVIQELNAGGAAGTAAPAAAAVPQ